jgi:uncharacterized membrane protein
MVLFPLSTFYFLFHVVFKKNPEMLGWSGIGAVIAANIVIALYVQMAWNEDKDPNNRHNSRDKRTIKTD